MTQARTHLAYRGKSRYLWGLGLGVLPFLIAGCGTTAAAAHARNPESTRTTASSIRHAVVLRVGKALVHGKKIPVVQTGNGMTLYYFTKDTPTQSFCSSAQHCDTIWHAMTATSSHVSAHGLPGRVTIVKDIHGRQLAYNGHLLYRYSADTKPGQALGEGILHTWWVATPTLTAATTTPANRGSRSSSSSSHSSYGSGSSSSTGTSSSSGGW